jgi:hypothetical protein
MAVKLKLKNVRLSYPNLSKPTDFKGDGNFNYNATFLVEKGSAEETQVNAAIVEVCKEAWPKTYQKDIAQLQAQGALKCCWQDGDEIGKDGYAGHMSLSAKRRQADGRPAVAARNGAPLNEGDEGYPYGGCYVVASVEIYAQDNSFGKGIRCGLRGVQFYKDGKSFGGASAVSAESEFDDLAEEFGDLV